MENSERFEEMAKGILGDCTCDEMYKSRDMIAPDCIWHNCHEDLIDGLQGAYSLDRDAPKALDGCVSVNKVKQTIQAYFEQTHPLDMDYDGLNELIDRLNQSPKQ